MIKILKKTMIKIRIKHLIFYKKLKMIKKNNLIKFSNILTIKKILNLIWLNRNQKINYNNFKMTNRKQKRE